MKGYLDDRTKDAEMLERKLGGLKGLEGLEGDCCDLRWLANSDGIGKIQMIRSDGSDWC